MIRGQELPNFLKAALECSVFADPLNPGLTFIELKEVAKQAGYLDGEVNDAITRLDHTYAEDSNNLLPGKQTTVFWNMYWQKDQPDFRNLEAFDFVYSEFNQALRELGAGGARLERGGSGSARGGSRSPAPPRRGGNHYALDRRTTG